MTQMHPLGYTNNLADAFEQVYPDADADLRYMHPVRGLCRNKNTSSVSLSSAIP